MEGQAVKTGKTLAEEMAELNARKTASVAVVEPEPAYRIRAGVETRPVYAEKRLKTIMVPMWTGVAIKGKDGILRADIAMCAIAEHINGGLGLRFYETQKRFKHVESIPAELIDDSEKQKFIDARDRVIAAEFDFVQRRKDMAGLGLIPRSATIVAPCIVELFQWWKGREHA